MEQKSGSYKKIEENEQGVQELKTVALELLLESEAISSEVKMEIGDIFNKVHKEKQYLLLQLAQYLTKKNPKIFEADTLIKNGHNLSQSQRIAVLGLNNEEKALLEWFQQVRA
jgi:hypothetical protein